MDFIIFISLLGAGYFFGTWAENRHYTSIQQREKELLHLPAVSLKNAFHPEEVAQAKMVYGNAVISVDYFKRLLAALRNIFGGTVKSYETLIDRARREALLRMKAAAPKDATVIVNVRIETTTVGKNAHKKGVGCVEALAYGTALTIKQRFEVKG